MFGVVVLTFPQDGIAQDTTWSQGMALVRPVFAFLLLSAASVWQTSGEHKLAVPAHVEHSYIFMLVITLCAYEQQDYVFGRVLCVRM